MDQPETIMEKGYGAALALPVWVDVMNSVPELKYPANRLEPPTPLVRVAMCSASGRRATSQCSYYCNVTTENLPASRVGNMCPLHPELAPAPIAEYAPQPTLTRPTTTYPRAEQAPQEVLVAPGMRRVITAPAPAPPTDRPVEQPRQQVIQQTERGFRIWNVPPPPLARPLTQLR
jgi:hypothetical protein